MPDREAQDAVLGVQVQLPNGTTVTGRLVPFRQGLKIKALLYHFSETMEQQDFDALWAAFSGVTGVTEDQLTALCPDITLLELTDLISRFIYLLRPGRTAVQDPTSTPAATADPAPAAPAPATTGA